MRKFGLFSKRSGRSTGAEWAADLAISSLFVLCISLACISTFFQLAGNAYYPQRANNNAAIKIDPADPKNGLPAPKQLAQWDNVMKTRLLHVAEVNGVVIGKDGWLYIDDANSMSDYRGEDPYTDTELANLAKVINNRRDWLSARGIPLLLVVAPNKESIYPEYLPDDIYKVNNTTRLDQFMQYMKLHSNVDILDLRAPLLQAKTSMPLYYATDSHWNNYGGFIGYTEIMKKLSQYFPYLKAYGLNDYAVSTSTGYNGDLQHLLFMDGLFNDQAVQMTLTNQPDIKNRDKIPSAVIYHDSFYMVTDLFLSQHIASSSLFSLGKDNMFDEAQIAQASPQIVIYVMVERYVDRYFPNP